MNQPKSVDQKKPHWSHTVLLATNGSLSIIAEVHSGKANPIAYSAYGEQSAEQEVATKLGFNGQFREANKGWYLLGNGYRAYNPRLMRFHSPDSWSPFGGGGLNAYMYCAGDPVNHSDPTGHVFDVVKLFVRENLTFGGSSGQLAAQNATRRANGIARQQARYALAAAGGTPTPDNRASTSSGLTAMLSFVGGAPGPRGNNSPAIQYTETRPRNHPGYVAGAAADGLTSRATRSTPHVPSSGGRGHSMSMSRSGAPPTYESPPSYESSMQLWNADTFARSQQGKAFVVNRMAAPNNGYLDLRAPRMEHPTPPLPPTPPRSRSPSLDSASSRDSTPPGSPRPRGNRPLFDELDNYNFQIRHQR